MPRSRRRRRLLALPTSTTTRAICRSARNCCVADVTPNGTLIYSNTQATYTTRSRVANVLGVPANTVRVKYYEGSSVYGYSGYDEAAEAAAVMSQLAGAPVRLQ